MYNNMCRRPATHVFAFIESFIIDILVTLSYRLSEGLNVGLSYGLTEGISVGPIYVLYEGINV